MRLGNNTFPNDIVIPIKGVPMNNVLIPITERMAIPKRFAIFEAIGETNANASNGKVESNPITVLLKPKLSRIIGTNAPTDANGALKFEANNRIPTTIKK